MNLDHAQHGLGSASSCGPGVLPEHRLAAEPAAFAFVLSARTA
ncbi:beta-galactosidase small subunit-related protein [Kitasatospora purpeofusca]